MKTSLILLMVLTAGPLFGHDYWIDRGPDGYVLLSGHRHSNHEGPDIIPYDPAIVEYVLCCDEQGDTARVETAPVYPLSIKESCPLLFVKMSSGYWTKTPYGTKNLPKNEVKSPVKSWLSLENVKRMDGWSDRFTGPVTGELELVPLHDPFKLKTGDKLRLTVFLKGEPCSRATVVYDGSVRGQTDADGRINIKIRHEGLQMIEAGITLPVDSDRMDQIVHTTNLNFETGEKK
jgi:nickel transport protein